LIFLRATIIPKPPTTLANVDLSRGTLDKVRPVFFVQQQRPARLLLLLVSALALALPISEIR
jgi:hypothetical protein